MAGSQADWNEVGLADGTAADVDAGQADLLASECRRGREERKGNQKDPDEGPEEGRFHIKLLMKVCMTFHAARGGSPLNLVQQKAV